MRAVLVCLVAGCSFEHGFRPGADASSATGDSVIAGDGAGATMTVLRPDADCWLRQQYPTENHANDLDVRIGSGSTVARANRGLVHFDLGPLPVPCTLSESRLFLYFFDEDFTSVSPTLEAHHVTASWSESSATWNSRSAGTAWTSPGGDFAAEADATAIVQAAAFGWISWDVTALVRQWRSGAVANFGVALLEPGDNTGTGGRKLFFSMQTSATPTDRRPHLSVRCD
jgi:hypothetical protein